MSLSCDYCDEPLEQSVNPTKVVKGNVEEGDVEGSYFEYYCSASCLTEEYAG